MDTELISVGTELLLGDILNTNAQFLSLRCASLGLNVRRHTTVGDNKNRLLAAIDSGFALNDLLIFTGGLGPTEDDLTKETVFEWFGVSMEVHEPSLKALEAYFARLGRTMAASNRKQALFPKEALVLQNPNGTAPGCILEAKGKIAIVLPGPPKEMQPMFVNEALPYLRRFCPDVLVSRTLHFIGIGESSMEEKVKHLTASQNPTLAPYAKTGECLLRITAKAQSEALARALIAPMEVQIKALLGEYIYGYDDDSLSSVCARLLTEKGLSLALAESCTGGLLAGRLVDNPGASSFLLESAVVYSNDAKIRRLGVKKETLDSYGAVSEECVREMALGIVRESGADLALSVSGIAGPEGGSPEKPVGTVCFAVVYKDQLVCETRHFIGNRDLVRERSVIAALSLIYTVLQK